MGKKTSGEFSCEKCNDRFPRKWNSERHQKTCKGTKEVVFKCVNQWCKKSFPAKWNRQHHTKACCHPNENQLQCFLCKKFFSRMSHLKRHLMSHSMNTMRKKIECSMCTKKFFNKEKYEQHNCERVPVPMSNIQLDVEEGCMNEHDENLNLVEETSNISILGIENLEIYNADQIYSSATYNDIEHPNSGSVVIDESDPMESLVNNFEFTLDLSGNTIDYIRQKLRT